MASFTPDFGAYYRNERFSDCDIEVLEDNAEVGEKRKRGLTIPGHSMVLVAFSNYCKVKLENWGPENGLQRPLRDTAHPSSRAKSTLQLLVPAGQTEMAMLLVRCMYQKDTAVTDLHQQQLLQLLMLADRFEVPKVQAAVLNIFKELSADDMDWDTAVVLLDVSMGCHDYVAYQEIVATAEAKLMQVLGDLELIWADKQLQKRLVSLPHAMLLRLLQHDQTSVANERTVVYTILQWWEEQQQSYRDNHVQQLKELMQQVRIQHLSLLYVSTFMMLNEPVRSCFTLHELAIACNCTEPFSRKALQNAQCPELQQYPAWTAARRPASKREQFLVCRPSVDQLRDTVEKTLDSKRMHDNCGPATVLQGQAALLTVDWTVASDTVDATGDCSNGVTLQLGVYIVLHMTKEAVSWVKGTFSVEAAGGVGSVRPYTSRGPCQDGLRSGDSGFGYADMITFRSVSSWSDVEAKLKQKNLIHADGCLHCSAEIVELA